MEILKQIYCTEVMDNLLDQCAASRRDLALGGAAILGSLRQANIDNAQSLVDSLEEGDNPYVPTFGVNEYEVRLNAARTKLDVAHKEMVEFLALAERVEDGVASPKKVRQLAGVKKRQLWEEIIQSA